MTIKYLFILPAILILQICTAQDIDWQQAQHWKLYDIREDAGLRYPVDTLKVFKFISVSDDTMHGFMKQVTAWPKEKYALWMGTYITTCEINNRTRKIDISVYGGFLYDEQMKQYYELPLAIRNEWMEYLNNAMGRLTEAK